MDLVKVDLFAQAYDGEITYEDEIWIKKSSYEKLKDKFPTKIPCGELGGDHSELIGEVEVETDWDDTDWNESKYLLNIWTSVKRDGDFLLVALENLYYTNDIDFDEEQEEINEFFDSLEELVDVEVSVPESKVDELLQFAEKLRKETR